MKGTSFSLRAIALQPLPIAHLDIDTALGEFLDQSEQSQSMNVAIPTPTYA